jgi:hypothetical protein
MSKKLIEQIESVLSESRTLRDEDEQEVIESFVDAVKKRKWVKNVEDVGEGIDITPKDSPKDRIYVEYAGDKFFWEDFNIVVPLGKYVKSAITNLEKAMELSLKDRPAFEKKYKRRK